MIIVKLPIKGQFLMQNQANSKTIKRSEKPITKTIYAQAFYCFCKV